MITTTTRTLLKTIQKKMPKTKQKIIQVNHNYSTTTQYLEHYVVPMIWSHYTLFSNNISLLVLILPSPIMFYVQFVLKLLVLVFFISIFLLFIYIYINYSLNKFKTLFHYFVLSVLNHLLTFTFRPSPYRNNYPQSGLCFWFWYPIICFQTKNFV